jgi:molecular chaperone DnaK (HSP70)
MAGDMIGLEVARLVNEPTAAALAWGYHEESERTIAVYDLGGGTFDVSILAIGHGVYSVLATRGDSWLGGEDFDKRLVDHLVKGFQKEHGVDIYKDKMAHQRIKSVAENAKIELSSKESVRIYLSSPCPDVVGADVDTALTRPRFESMIEDLVDRTIETFKRTLEDAEMDMDEIDSAVLVGGMTRMPLVRQKIEELIGRPADSSVNPDEAIAIGAALHASALAGEKILLSPPASTRQKPAEVEEKGLTAGGAHVEILRFWDDAQVTMEEAWQVDQQSEQKPVGDDKVEILEVMVDNPAAAGEARQEYRQSEQKLAGVDKVEILEAMFDAPEVVGEAWQEGWQFSEQPAGQAAARDGSEKSFSAAKVIEGTPVDEPAVAMAEPRIAKAPLLIDVLSQSVGISDMAGLFVPLIERNSKLPAKVSQVVTTCIDQQEAIRISVYQGEERYAKDQAMLGEFVLQGIETASRGVPQVKVTFKIDPSGMFAVSAKDLKTNAEKEILIEDVLIGEGGQTPSYMAGKESTKTL